MRSVITRYVCSCVQVYESDYSCHMIRLLVRGDAVMASRNAVIRQSRTDMCLKRRVTRAAAAISATADCWVCARLITCLPLPPLPSVLPLPFYPAPWTGRPARSASAAAARRRPRRGGPRCSRNSTKESARLLMAPSCHTSGSRHFSLTLNTLRPTATAAGSLPLPTTAGKGMSWSAFALRLDGAKVGAIFSCHVPALGR